MTNEPQVQEFKRHSTQQFNSAASTFVFRERDKVLRSVINATEPSQRESFSQTLLNTLPRAEVSDSDVTMKPNYCTVQNTKNKSSLNLNSFTIRKIEHMKGYLPVSSGARGQNEVWNETPIDEDSFNVNDQLLMIEQDEDLAQSCMQKLTSSLHH